MARFHINIFNDVDTIDEEGTILPGLPEAKDLAIAGARAMIAAHVVEGRPVNLQHRIEVADEGGRVLAVIPFSEVVTILA